MSYFLSRLLSYTLNITFKPMYSKRITRTIVGSYLLLSVVHGFAFTAPLFQSATINRITAPSTTDGVELEFPNFNELFSRIQQVSPLARQVLLTHRSGKEGYGGFELIDDDEIPNMKWKKVETNKKKALHQIQKIENFQNIGAPIMRFRASLKGPCLGEPFANFIMSLDERKKWDAQIAKVEELYSIKDLESVNNAMGFGKYGDCTRFGVGYCQTKSKFGISPREQLTLCGVQDFPDGSHIIWGTELLERHNNLLPMGMRYPRAKSHIFCTTMTPTGDSTFDVEYVLHMEPGGNLPLWLTTPVLTDAVKHLFRHAESYFSAGEGSEIQHYLLEKEEHNTKIAKTTPSMSGNPPIETVPTTDVPSIRKFSSRSVFGELLQRSLKRPIVRLQKKLGGLIENFLLKQLRVFTN